MRRARLVVTMYAGVLLSTPAVAQDATLGRNLAATCANCHGTNGVSEGGTQSLAGMKQDALAQAMKDFKTGARGGTVMPQLAKGYTDAQIEALAAWFAAREAGTVTR